MKPVTRTALFFGAGLFLLAGFLEWSGVPAQAQGAIKKMGQQCSSGGECLSGDCERSALSDGQGGRQWFCDCDFADDCVREYGEPTDGGTWECRDGGDFGYDLDYCVSSGKKDVRIYTVQGAPPQKPSLTDFLFDTEAAAEAFKTKFFNEARLFKPKLNIRIPGLEYADPKQTLDAEGYIYVPYLGQFVAAIYKFGLAVASIVAVVMLMNNGFKIVMSASGEDKANGIKRVGQILVGIVILWGSYAILYALNPNLVAFKALRVKYVEPVSLLAYLETEEAAEAPERPPGQVERIVTISSPFFAYGMQVGASVAEDIKKAAEELYNETKSMPGGPYKLTGGGYRPLSGNRDAQVEKWVRNCEGRKACSTPVCNPFPKAMLDVDNRRRPGAVPDARLCPHTSGVGLDFGCALKERNSRLDIEQFYAPCQRKLEEIMLRKNFCRLSSEPWHFERPKMMGSCSNITGKASRKQTGATWDYSSCNGYFSLNTKACSPELPA